MELKAEPNWVLRPTSQSLLVDGFCLQKWMEEEEKIILRAAWSPETVGALPEIEVRSRFDGDG